MNFSELYTRVKYLSLAVVHSSVSVLAFATVYDHLEVGSHVESVEVLPVLSISITSIIIYLITGVPGVVFRNCRDCGGRVAIGRLRCGECGETANTFECDHRLLKEGVWFFLGYPFLLVIWLSVVYNVEPTIFLYPGYAAALVLYSSLLFIISQWVGELVGIPNRY